MSRLILEMQQIIINFSADVSKAFETFTNLISPAKRKIIDRQKHLENGHLQALIKKQNAEALLINANAESGQAQAQRTFAEAKKLIAEKNLIVEQTRKEQISIDKMYFELAKEIVDFASPADMEPKKKMQSIFQIFELLKRGNLTSNLFSIAHDDEKTKP